MRAMHAPLLAEILADPRAIAPRLVYADALLEAGEPRGELIQVQCVLEELDADDPARDALEARAADLLALHEPGWTWELRARCELHDRASELRYRRGFVECVELRASRVPALMPILTELTPLRKLRVSFDTGAETLGSVPGLMDLEGLSVQGVMNGDDPVRAFASWPHRGRLRMLHLGNLTPGSAGSAVAGMPAMAGLESLSLGTIADDDLVALAAAAHLARLRQLRLSVANLDGFGLRVLGRSEALRSLEVLDLGRAMLRDRPRVYASELPALARLRELRSRGPSFSTPSVIAIATAAPDLEVLDLEAVKLEDAGARALLCGETALARLRHLDLSRTELSDEGFAGMIDALEVPGLRRLACVGNALASKAAAAIAASRALDELQQLFLASCPLGDTEVTALAESEHLPALRVLDLSLTRCGRDGLDALGASDLGARLVSLDLSHNMVCDRDLGALLAGRRLDRLEHLALDGMMLSSAGVRALAAAPLAARLRSLTIWRWGSDAVAQLSRAELPELRTLVTGNLDDRAAILLAGMRSAPWLQYVVLHAPELTDDGALALANAVDLQRITWLELSAPHLGEVGRDALRRRFGPRVGIFAVGSPHALSSRSSRRF